MRNILSIFVFVFFAFSLQAQDLKCCNGNTPTLSVPNGTGWTYAWSNGGSNNSTTVNLSGTYTVTVTNSAGCSAVDSYVVEICPPLIAQCLKVEDNTSCDNPNGEAIVQTQGTNIGCSNASTSQNPGAFTYQWSNGQTTQTATGLDEGTYTVTLTDSFGCTSTCNVTINSTVDAPNIDITGSCN